jgi:hypothetical protein
MKLKILLCLLVLTLVTSTLKAQDVGQPENDRNKILYNNAAKSQEYLKQSGKYQEPAKVFGGGQNTTIDESKLNLTDQEKQLKDNFYDVAGANKIIKEKCVGEMEQACAGEEVKHKTMGMDPTMIKLAGQAYATIGAMGGDSLFPLKKGSGEWMNGDKKPEGAAGGANGSTGSSGGSSTPSTEAPKADAGKPKEENTTDYCKYIPVATETFATFAQKATTTQLSSGSGTPSQKDQLLKAAKSHDSRANQAQIQAVGWFGGAACYAQGMVRGEFAMSTGAVVKLGASAFLGAFYQGEVSANKEYARKTREIAESLPGKGDCNPITQNTCYCKTPEYANDPVFCKNAAQQAAGTNFLRVACTNDKLELDPSCACEKSGTCFDKVMSNGQSVDLNAGGFGFANSPYKMVSSLTKGKLENGMVNGTAAAQAAAIAKKALQDIAGKIPQNNSPINPKNKALYDALLSKGIPPSIARTMAENQPPAGASNNGLAKVQGNGVFSGFNDGDGGGKSGGRVVDFSGGAGLGIGGKKASENKNEMGDFMSKLGKGKEGNLANGKVLEFAQRAQAQASQISKSDRALFEIISLRYQISGRRLLQIDDKK